MESPFKAEILKGKVALLTGGGSGIGYEIAAELGKHGASIAVMGRRKLVLDSAVSSLHSLGIQLLLASELNHTSFAIFASKSVMDIDSVGTFTMCHEALKYLKKGVPGKDSSSNISATFHYMARWYQVHVCAAKAAIDSLTRSLALVWGTDHDVRDNGIAPGPIQDTAGYSKIAPEEIRNKIREERAGYKAGEKWDIGMAALYLASDAGKYVNGTRLAVDGGMWFSGPRHISKEALKLLSLNMEKRSQSAPVGVPKSKL